MTATIRDPAVVRRARLAWICVGVAVLVLLQLARSWAYIDHCDAGITCDFGGYWVQVRHLFQAPPVVEDLWVYPPATAVLFSVFRPLPLVPGAIVWILLNFILLFVMTRWCAKLLASLGKARWPAAAALVLTSFPVIHSVKWGQISLLIVVLAIAGLRSRRGGWLIGAVTAFKLYPLGYALLPLARRDWRKLASAAGATIVIGAAIPLAVLGWTWTRALAVKMLALPLDAETEWMLGHSAAYWGGQGLAPSFVRYWRDGGHVNLADHAAPLLFSLPSAAVQIAALVAGVAILVATYRKLRTPAIDPSRAAALCLTAFTLAVQPAWHHYFAFFPFAMAVVLGEVRSSPLARWLVAAAWVISAIPVLFAADFHLAYYTYSAWGGTTVAALLLWAALILEPRAPAVYSSRA